MKSFTLGNIEVRVCTDIIEWAKEFYDMPQDSKLVNIEEVSQECMGFANIDDKIIWIFVPKHPDIDDIKTTIAHEVGHIIEFNHQSNLEQIDENDEMHEAKANYYMNYYLLVDKMVNIVAEIATWN